MANPEMDFCFICDKSLEEGDQVVVKERGVQTLLKSSVKRENREHVRILRSLSSVTVHAACQKNYNNEKLITAYLRKIADAPPVASTSRRSSIPRFDFESQCFLCTEEITLDFLNKKRKKSLSDRDIIYRVEKLEVKETILKAANERGDEWGRQIIERIQHVMDLVAVEARYHLSCQKRLYNRVPSGQKRGYRPATNVDEAMEYIFTYLTENSEECQFPLDELMDQIEGEYLPDVRTVKSRLLKKYGDDILIIERNNRSPVVCFRDTGYTLLAENWYTAKNSNPEEERLRVVKEAAAIILADIRSQNYDMSEYPPSDRFLNQVNSAIPQSLQVFFHEIIVKKKRSSFDKWNRICESLSHAVISAVRPRSFLSSLLIGVSTYLYKKFGSRKLINMLSSLGFAASYSETTLFEKSAVVRPGVSIDQHAFSQFICDNADHNVNTIDGLHTVHIMGAIQCVTPHDSVLPDENISRATKLPSAQVIGEIGSFPLSLYNKRHDTGLKTIKIADVEEKHPLLKDILPSSPDFLWLYGKWSKFQLPGWNGFMEQAMADKSFMRSKIICLPFISYPPSEYDTIYTTLLMAVEKSKTSNQKTIFVTFDQPLYAKGQEIVANNPLFRNVVVRLGGFHLLMSFLGAIGYIMAGSGLKELFTTIYAENSVDKMLAGHAYARAIRAHMLCHLALAHVILEYLEFDDDERAFMEQLLGHLDKSMILKADESEPFRVVVTKFKEVLTKLEKNGPTAKLWVQYFQMVTLVKHFIAAERMGDWQLHLDTVQRMLPYFHASGHFLYAKCAHLYLQDMLDLEEKMDPAEYHKFTTEACFTIRRTDKFWSGIWSDMTIEQTLMRMMHSCGGLTRGRGISDSVLALWTLGMISLHNVCDSVEEYCNVHLDTSEQHVDTRTSRITRDDQDLKKILNWLSQHQPFPEIELLLSISTGVVGDAKINCHLSREKGIECMSNMVTAYENYESIKFKRKDKVIPLAAVNSSIKIGTEIITINPLMLFQRMCIAKKSDNEMKEYFTFELAPFPMSLFSEDGMRKGTKSSLYAIFTPLSEGVELGDNKINVVDGGYLLHKVVWHRSDSFGSICEKYVQYVRNHYGSNAIVVFDGYPSDGDKKNTKSAERLRRTKKQMSAEVFFDETMTVQVSQERFLANEQNKARLISMLTNKFEQAAFTVKQAEEDADVLIVNTAISFCSSFDAVFIVGEDVDLLVLLTALGSSKTNIYLHKPGRGKTAERVYSANSLKVKEAAENILFLHAVSGCDTTSSLFNQGKTKFVSLIQKNKGLNDVIAIFKNQNAKPEDIADAGARFLVALYGGNMEEETLEEVRYQRFAKATLKSKFNLASLPPTKDAARYHAFRTYHQVQKWCGIEKNPSGWGWKLSTNGLTPVPMAEKPAPDTLLNVISCHCKKGCGGACGCRKSGLKCTVVCGFCNGESCENAPDIIIESDDEDEAMPWTEDTTEDDYDGLNMNQPGPSKKKK